MSMICTVASFASGFTRSGITGGTARATTGTVKVNVSYRRYDRDSQ